MHPSPQPIKMITAVKDVPANEDMFQYTDEHGQERRISVTEYYEIKCVRPPLEHRIPLFYLLVFVCLFSLQNLRNLPLLRSSCHLSAIAIGAGTTSA